MPCTIVVGGQYGSEGKGKVCAYLGATENAHIMVRCGGPNSGHTVADEKNTFVLRQLPAGAPNLKCRLLIPAGAYVVPELLFQETKQFGVNESRVGIDQNCIVITQEMINAEQASDLQKRIGSTLSGTGAAVNARVSRSSDRILAKNMPTLRPFITDVAGEIVSANRKGLLTIIEGTQGFGLSLYHSPYYPFTTSRDTTAAGFVSEVGISPKDVDEIVMVIRAFPIRVGGNSGPLTDEITWKAVTRQSGAPFALKELTSVTRRLRRIAEFDPQIVRRAIQTNKPTKIVLNHVDYVNWIAHGTRDTLLIPDDVVSFVHNIEQEIDYKVSLIGTGPCTYDFVSSSGLTKNLIHGEVKKSCAVTLQKSLI
ncbi:MAG: adenylosuccinate synthetase [Planctomycetota bacterium]|jgi:adenylosuccinate synthase